MKQLNEYRSKGLYYDGETLKAHPAILVCRDGKAVLDYDGTPQVYPLNDLQVSPRSGRGDRFITLPDGGQFQARDDAFLDQLPQEVRSEGMVAWLEDRQPVAIGGVILVLITILLGYFYGLPLAADSVVERIPMRTEQALGNHVLSWFDEKKWFLPSELDQDRLDSLTKRFDMLHQDLPMSSFITLEFRKAKFIGPNAFAIPGGTIVVTDQLIELTSSEEEILAVLAHEIGHVEMRHSIRNLLKSSIVGLTAATITADAASLSAAVASLPAVVAQTKYSRDFEVEADDYAFELLKLHGISPTAFADIMAKIDGSDAMKGFSYLSTHPITSERINKAREAANPE
jgi:Zn-dependent protease with chaperone function